MMKSAILLLLLFLPWCRAEQQDGWTVFHNCELIQHGGNDADSFHVKADGRHLLVRLYFVDAPETSMSFPQRVTDQLEYFNTDQQSVLKGGMDGARFVRNLLKDGFSIYTKFEDARGRSSIPRHFCMIKLNDAWLAELLVGAGLARIYGMFTALPDGSSGNAFIEKLRMLERNAQREQLGVWAAQVQQVQPVVKATVIRSTVLYSLDDNKTMLGTLQRGTVVNLIEELSPFMVKVEFSQNGSSISGQCRRNDLKISEEPRVE